VLLIISFSMDNQAVLSLLLLVAGKLQAFKLSSRLAPISICSLSMEIAMESPRTKLKKIKLEMQGLAWISLLNDMKCLVCADLGDAAIIARRSPLPRSPCNSMV
jgi:hypothetical protein